MDKACTGELIGQEVMVRLTRTVLTCLRSGGSRWLALPHFVADFVAMRVGLGRLSFRRTIPLRHYLSTPVQPTSREPLPTMCGEKLQDDPNVCNEPNHA